MEKERVELLNEVRKRNNCQIINEKMAKTFSIHRNEHENEHIALSFQVKHAFEHIEVHVDDSSMQKIFSVRV